MSKLILTNEVSGLGSAGDVVEVKDGYARNYLIPNGLAVAWTKGGEKQVASIRAARNARAIASEEDARNLKAKLEQGPIKITMRSGLNGRLFGAVKTADVAAAVSALGYGELDKRKIELGSTIRTVGRYDVTIRLTGEIVAKATIQVVSAK
jgi:large subunit ribosomal protein L9